MNRFPQFLNKFFLAIVVLLCFINNKVFAQKKTNPTKGNSSSVVTPNFNPPVSDEKPAIRLIATLEKNHILLRWAPNTPIAWQRSNKYGVYIERYTILRTNANGQLELVPHPERILLTDSVLKAAPAEIWEKRINENDQIAIIAQCLFGGSLEVSGESASQSANPMAQMIQKVQNDEKRFAFSLGAADQNFEAACLAGWGYVDSTVKEGEKYLYRVFVATPKESKIKIDTGSVFIGVMDTIPLPKPAEVFVKFGDKQALLGWNFSRLNSFYTGYFIERSSDKKIFKKLTEQPFVPLTIPANGFVYYTDSLPDNMHVFYYRIRGINSFGQLGTPSDTLSGKGLEQLMYVPSIQKHSFLPSGNVIIEWDFPQESTALLRQFILTRSTDYGSKLDTLAMSIAPEKRQIEIKANQLENSNYLKIIAEDTLYNTKSSLVYFVQPVDSIAPAIPIGLQGAMDTLGKVHLSWKSNTEKDLQGYFILRANYAKEELIMLTQTCLTDTVYIDSTINKKLLVPEVFYAIVAVDKRMNQSLPCTRICIEKPNPLPLYPPVFTQYENQDKKIVLKWSLPTQKSVIQQRLYKRKISDKQDTLWKEIFLQTDFSKNQFVDTQLRDGETYQYALKAFSENKESNYSLPVNIQRNTSTVKLMVSGLYATYHASKNQVEISWKLPNTPILGIEIFRKKNQESLVRIASLPPHTTTFIEALSAEPATIEYGIRILNKENILSSLQWYKIRIQ